MFIAAPIPPSAVACPGCSFALPLDALSRENETACPQCRAVLSGGLFPAFWQPATAVTSIADHAAEGDAVCFFHPENRAALSCDRCGRFLCPVCDMPLGTRHLCPTCLSSGLTGDKLQELVVGRFQWADTALLLGALPLLLCIFIWPVLIITGTTAIFCALFGWKKPGSLPRGRRHWAAVLGLILGLIQLAGWFAVIFLLSNSAAFQRAFQ